jgi:hypothetical protein
MTSLGTTGWRAVGVAIERRPIQIHDLNVWDYNWTRLPEPPLELPHPSYPSQLHMMRVYEITANGEHVRFAAGELSANVWGFYVPA